MPKIVKGFMACWFDQKFKLPKFRLLNFRGAVGFTHRKKHVTQLFQNWTQKYMEQ